MLWAILRWLFFSYEKHLLNVRNKVRDHFEFQSSQTTAKFEQDQASSDCRLFNKKEKQKEIPFFKQSKGVVR